MSGCKFPSKRDKLEKQEEPEKPEKIMIRYLIVALIGLVLMAGATTALAQEPRHIEIRIINPSAPQQPQSKEPANESIRDKVGPGPSRFVQSDDLSQVIRQSMPAVVTIITDEGLGSGFFVSSDGYLLTNSHVVRQGGWPTVRLADGKSVSASVVRNDEEKDLALLKASGSGYPTLPLGDSSRAAQGESVIAIGSPIGLEGTVTRGIISAVRQAVSNGVTYIQTDAAVNPGNSGGPLLNKAGQVIGINTMTIKSSQADTERLGFAISINDAKKFMNR
jgi:S1-C subfamily serine protease